MQKQLTHEESPPIVRHAEEGNSIFPGSVNDRIDFSFLEEAILRVLLYYDIWAHPLTAHEIHNFLPVPLGDRAGLEHALTNGIARGLFRASNGYFFAPHRSKEIVSARKKKEAYAARLWVIARFSMHIIKRFPFVRAVFVSGELSKNVSSPQGDVDFFILTAPGRLWIARTLLVAFKKMVLFNRKKFFCLNYFTSSDHLKEEDRNIYVASEVAHLKPLFNRRLFQEYQSANKWIMDFFPNHHPSVLWSPETSDRRSLLQRLLELPFFLLPSTRMDKSLQRLWLRTWARRYPEVGAEMRNQIFTSTNTRSRAYIGNFQTKILEAYRDGLNRYGLDPQSPLHENMKCSA